MSQLDLFSGGRRAVQDSRTYESTSQAAARQIRPVAPRLRQRVYDYIACQGAYGATRLEIQAATGMPGDTVRPRVKELIAEGRVTETDRRRRTNSGRMANVLVALYPRVETRPSSR